MTPSNVVVVGAELRGQREEVSQRIFSARMVTSLAYKNSMCLSFMWRK
jgi:hypothetical protein